MGTRAMISVDGKQMIATHWDGYPDSLGEDLTKIKPDISSIIRVAEKHTIDFAHSSIRKDINDRRVKSLMKKHKLSEAKIKKGVRRGNVIEASDYEVETIKGYDDWAEFEYDINSKTGEVKVRPVGDTWQQAKKGKWKIIRESIAKSKLKKVL